MKKNAMMQIRMVVDFPRVEMATIYRLDFYIIRARVLKRLYSPETHHIGATRMKRFLVVEQTEGSFVIPGQQLNSTDIGGRGATETIGNEGTLHVPDEHAVEVRSFFDAYRRQASKEPMATVNSCGPMTWLGPNQEVVVLFSGSQGVVGRLVTAKQTSASV